VRAFFFLETGYRKLQICLQSYSSDARHACFACFCTVAIATGDFHVIINCVVSIYCYSVSSKHKATRIVDARCIFVYDDSGCSECEFEAKIRLTGFKPI